MLRQTFYATEEYEQADTKSLYIKFRLVIKSYNRNEAWPYVAFA